MSKRIEQVESTIQRALALVLSRKISDPRIAGLVSITQMKVSPDMRQATVYVSIMPEQYESRTIHGLQNATGHIHRLLKKQVALRVVPHLRFELDDSIKKQAAIHQALKDARERSGDAIDQPADDEASPTGDDDAMPTPVSENDNDSNTSQGTTEDNQSDGPASSAGKVG